MLKLAKKRRKKIALAHQAGFRLRLLSYNIHQGLTIHRRKIAMSILKEAIKALGPDIVLLQEVAGESKEGKKIKEGISGFQLEHLADEIWPHYAYQKNAIFSGGFHGNAILSRYPIQRWNHVDITVKPFDKRGLLHGQIHVPKEGLDLHVMALHLGLLQFERKRQLKLVVDYVKNETPTGSPLFIAGDFNDWRQKISKGLSRRLGLSEAFKHQDAKHARTFPSRLPLLQLDRIYFRHAVLQQARCLSGQPWKHLSDHLPILADFVVKDA